MKWLVYLLLAANLTFFAWHYQQRERAQAVPDTPEEPAYVSRLLLLSEAPPQTAAPTGPGEALPGASGAAPSEQPPGEASQAGTEAPPVAVLAPAQSAEPGPARGAAVALARGPEAAAPTPGVGPDADIPPAPASAPAPAPASADAPAPDPAHGPGRAPGAGSAPVGATAPVPPASAPAPSLASAAAPAPAPTHSPGAVPGTGSAQAGTIAPSAGPAAAPALTTAGSGGAPEETTAATGPAALPAPAQEVIAPAAPPASPRCYALGPLGTEEPAAALRNWLGQRGASAELRWTTRQEPRSFWVYLPPVESAEQARALTARLTEAGVKDIMRLPAGANANAISLGLYLRRPDAERRLAEIKRLGYEPAIEVRHRDVPEAWVDVRYASGAELPAEALRGAFPDVRVEAADCP